MTAVPVPVLRLPPADDPRRQTHVLVVEGDTPEERSWEIEHSRCCPRVCRWWPGAREQVAMDDGMFDGLPPLAMDEHDCLVEWELINAGLDSMSGEVDGVYYDGMPLGPHLGWRAMPPGRYLVEGFYEPGGWAGAEPVDPGGGIILLGREEEE